MHFSSPDDYIAEKMDRIGEEDDVEFVDSMQL